MSFDLTRLNTVAFTLLALLPAVSHGAADLEKLKSMSVKESQLYRQTSYKLVDVEGDFALRLRSWAVVNTIGRVLGGNEEMNVEALPEDQYDREGLLTGAALQADVEAKIHDIQKRPGLSARDRSMLIVDQENRLVQIEGLKNPIKRDGFRQMFARILQEEEKNGLKISAGKVHVWSPEVRSAYPGDMILNWPKLLVALASGFSSQVLLTDTQDELIQWAVSQPRDSITMASLFRQSLRLNKGDVYLTMLTMENVLSAHWRIPGRDALPLTRRLQTIHNQWGGGGDKFGFWYHLTGTALYGYGYGDDKAGFAGFIETTGSHILSGFEREPQENFANKLGGQLGDDLAKMVKDRSYRTVKTSEKDLLSSSYLDLTEDFTDRLEVGADPNVVLQLTRGDSDLQGGIVIRLRSGRLDKCQVDVTVISERASKGQTQTYKNQSLSAKTDWATSTMLAPPAGRLKVKISGCTGMTGASFATSGY